ncbi:MAG: ThiF family adenylyltransferase [Anaerolineae bacterium]|nr:ThiF family adenylyltransferase [Anaerolineae bacterium]
MNYTLSLSRHAAETLRAHLLGDRSREQMAITLCGVNRLHHELRLLVRDVILLPPDAFHQQTATYLELKPEVQSFIHQRAHRHGLIQVDWHSHPGQGHLLAFSPIDDRHEAAQAAYLVRRMDGVPYGSVLVSDEALDARLWLTPTHKRQDDDGRPKTTFDRPQSHPMHSILTGDLTRRAPLSVQRLSRAASKTGSQPDRVDLSTIFDRQVRAFGPDLQHTLNALRVGVIGLGGLGSALVDHLARLGVRDWVLVDPDVVELSNLNRLVSATLTDAQKARPKVNVARSIARQPNPQAHVQTLQVDVFDPQAVHALKACDLLIAATDNHASRMLLNRLAAQYLIPLLHVGFHIGVGSDGQIEDVSGEFALPDLGCWCLHCAGIIDPQQAGWELAPLHQREALRQRGYVTGVPAPAVRHLDGIVASLAAAEVHNLAHPFKPLQRYLTYDAIGRTTSGRPELMSLQVSARSDCPVCSADDGVLGLGDLEPLPSYRRSSQVQLPSADLLQSLASVTDRREQVPAALVTGQESEPPDRAARVRRLQAAMEEADTAGR